MSRPYDVTVSDQYYIVTTNGEYYSWNNYGSFDDRNCHTFRFLDGKVVRVSDGAFLTVSLTDNRVQFTADVHQATPIEVVPIETLTHYKLKVADDRFIRHRDFKLFADRDDGSVLFMADSTWLLVKKVDTVDMDHEVVVARYNENTNWVRFLPFKVTIYNKGRNNLIKYHANVVCLANIGREGHTYLHHIVHNYDNLASRISFVQGKTTDHGRHTLELLLTAKEHPLSFMPLNEYHDINGPPQWVTEKYRRSFKGLFYSIFPLRNDLEIPDDVKYVRDKFDNYCRINNITYDKILPFFLRQTDFKHLIQDSYDCTLAGLFSVAKTNIIQHPRTAYKNLLEGLIERDALCQGFEYYILEKLWYSLFNDEPPSASQ